MVPVIDLELEDPLSLNLEDDADGNGRPDDALTGQKGNVCDAPDASRSGDRQPTALTRNQRRECCTTTRLLASLSKRIARNGHATTRLVARLCHESELVFVLVVMQ